MEFGPFWPEKSRRRRLQLCCSKPGRRPGRNNGIWHFWCWQLEAHKISKKAMSDTIFEIWFDYNYGRPPAMLAAGHSVLPLWCRSSFFFFSPPNLRCRLADRHQTLPHVQWWPRFIKLGQNFGGPFLRNLVAPKHQNFGVISDNFATWSRISPVRNKTSSIGKRHRKIRTLPHRQLIRCTLVYKRSKLGADFWPTQRAAIRLGIATHLVVIVNL